MADIKKLYSRAKQLYQKGRLQDAKKVFEKVLHVTNQKSTIVAIGNMGGMGAETAEFFENRSSINND